MEVFCGRACFSCQDRNWPSLSHTPKTKFVAKKAIVVFRWFRCVNISSRDACPVKSKPCPALRNFTKPTSRIALQWLTGWGKSLLGQIFSTQSYSTDASFEFIPLSCWRFRHQPYLPMISIWGCDGRSGWEPCRWVSHTPQIWWIPICDVSTPKRTSVMCVVGWVQPNITMWYYLSLLFEGCPNCHCPLPPSILFHFTHTM